MAKQTTRYVCQNCGAVSGRWQGRCESCGEWNTITAEAPSSDGPRGLSSRSGAGLAFEALTGATDTAPRLDTKMPEFDRVLGGGLVPGSAVLIGGDPGIGKSTLLLQVVCRLALGGNRCAYISGEEAIDQVRLRARRLGLEKAPVDLAAATSVRDIVAALDSATPPALAVIDSIQTMYLDLIESAPGTVGQVRASAQELIRVAKKRGTVLLMIGHVTKEGTIAGPRVLEHMVDTVLYFEGERGHSFRILRTVKNRFGPTDEIGVFEMGEKGLAEVGNPSALFLGQRHGPVSGSAVFAGIEGTRPLLVEVQALVAPAPPGSPRRAVVGWDSGRLAMVIAVLEARCGVRLADNDIYLNVAGGLKVTEPAADLAVAAALLSALNDQPLPAEAVVFGEIGLGGEVRGVGQTEARLKEAAKLGFNAAWLPKRRGGNASQSLAAVEIDQLDDLVALFHKKPSRSR